MMNKKNLCLRCGKCCKVIHLQHNVGEVEATNAPVGWLESHWRLIRISEFQEGKFFLYDCDEYDHQIGQCQIQSYKPGVCSDYPEYDNILNQDNYKRKLIINCGYRRLFEKIK